MNNVELFYGDVRETLRQWPDNSLHLVITSPPYLGLRDYKIPATVWGGDASCAHEWEILPTKQQSGGTANSTLGVKSGSCEATVLRSQERQMHQAPATGLCRLCKAWLGTLGSEPTPEMFLEHMVEIFRDLRRVLRDDGLCFVDMGDSYADDTKWGGTTGGKHAAGIHGKTGIGRLKQTTGLKRKDLMMMPARLALALQLDGWHLRSQIPWIKTSPMPESVDDRPTTAIEYVYMLSKTPWYFYDKLAVQVESSPVSHPRGNQPHKYYGTSQKKGEDDSRAGAHTYASLIGRGGLVDKRNWRNSDPFFESLKGLLHDIDGDPMALVVNASPMIWQFCDDCKAVFSPEEYNSLRRTWLCERLTVAGVETGCNVELSNLEYKRIPKTEIEIEKVPAGWDTSTGNNGPHRLKIGRYSGNKGAAPDMRHTPEQANQPPNGRTMKGDVRKRRICPCGADQWIVKVWCSCGSFEGWGSHFAAFPEALVEPLIKCGSSEKGCCSECGSPWERVIKPSEGYEQFVGKGSDWSDSARDAKEGRGHSVSGQRTIKRTTSMCMSYDTVGWQPTCECPSQEPIPCTVVDIFHGSGTTGVVATRLGRHYRGIDVKREYLDLSKRRIEQDNPLFNVVTISST